MKKPFEVGERVAVYCGNRDVGEIKKIEPDGTMLIYCGYNRMSYVVHPFQCRRLKKKQRRELWIAEYKNSRCTFLGIFHHATKEECEKIGKDKEYQRAVKFVEVK